MRQTRTLDPELARLTLLGTHMSKYIALEGLINGEISDGRISDSRS
ncbi:MAG TPA: hypothetical protein VLK33_14500 [Terriglobales bacterium]|nr:hypothetical protein [Terriglobales bacterium]